MGLILAALFGIVGGAVTNYLLRDKLGVGRIFLAIAAGILGGLLVTVLLTLLIYYFTRLDFSFYAIVGSVLGPPATALAAWRWRPKMRDPGGLRA